MREQNDRRYPIQEDMRFQRRTWVVERIAWIGFALVRRERNSWPQMAVNRV